MSCAFLAKIIAVEISQIVAVCTSSISHSYHLLSDEIEKIKIDYILSKLKNIILFLRFFVK